MKEITIHPLRVGTPVKNMLVLHYGRYREALLMSATTGRLHRFSRIEKVIRLGETYVEDDLLKALVRIGAITKDEVASHHHGQRIKSEAEQVAQDLNDFTSVAQRYGVRLTKKPGPDQSPEVISAARRLRGVRA